MHTHNTWIRASAGGYIIYKRQIHEYFFLLFLLLLLLRASMWLFFFFSFFPSYHWDCMVHITLACTMDDARAAVCLSSLLLCDGIIIISSSFLSLPAVVVVLWWWFCYCATIIFSLSFSLLLLHHFILVIPPVISATLSPHCFWLLFASLRITTIIISMCLCLFTAVDRKHFSKRPATKCDRCHIVFLKIELVCSLLLSMSVDWMTDWRRVQ